MNADARRSRLNGLTETIIGCAFEVSNALGSGFLEKVYENALAHELRKSSLTIEPQYRFLVRYDGIVVGEYFADLYVEKSVIVEVKAIKHAGDQERAQCLNYLHAADCRIGLILNFGTPKVQVIRMANDF